MAKDISPPETSGTSAREKFHTDEICLESGQELW